MLWRIANKFGLIKFQAGHKQARETERERASERACQFVAMCPEQTILSMLETGKKKRDKLKQNLCQAVN